jgi:hypothetical protein
MDRAPWTEEEGTPRRAAPPLSRADALVYARACLPEEVDEAHVPAYAALVRSVLADIRDLPG